MPANNNNNTCTEVPRVIVFDLDGTLWNPEMYQLSGGAPFTPDHQHNNNSGRLDNYFLDKHGTKVHLIGETREVLTRVLNEEAFEQTYLALSSTCDEPAWAKELMRLFHFEKKISHNNNNNSAAEVEKVPMHRLFGDLKEIYYANKSDHHRTILKKVNKMDPSVTDFSQFIFFDNQRNNISDVSKLGVCSVYCGSGMTPGTFERGLQMWRQMHKL